MVFNGKSSNMDRRFWNNTIQATGEILVPQSSQPSSDQHTLWMNSNDNSLYIGSSKLLTQLNFYTAGLPTTSTVIDTAPSDQIGVSWTVVLIKGTSRRISTVTGIRDGNGVVTSSETNILIAPSNGTFDITITAGGDSSGITLIATPSSSGWSARGIRRPYT